MEIDRSKLEAYIDRINPQPCPLCGQNSWSINNRVFQLGEYETSESLRKRIENKLDSKCVPLVPLTCDNCGNTYLINAILTDLIDPNENNEHAVNENEK